MRRFYHVLGMALLALAFLTFAAANAWGESAPASSGSGASSAAVKAASEVRVRDKVVLTLRAARGGRSAPERARAANAAIESQLAHPEDIGDARFEEAPENAAVVYLGKTPVLTLGPEDVEASGEASVQVLAAQTTTRLGDAVNTERKRSAIATTVFSLSLVIFTGLLAFLLLGRVSDGANRLRSYLVDPERVGALRLGNVEFVSAGATRGGVTIGVTLAYRLIQIAIIYFWLIFSLSLFEATRSYTERLTGMIGKPLSGLAGRIGGALPLLVVALIAFVAVSVLVRFIGLVFDSVARGDTKLAWVPRDLARPTSVLLRFGVIVAALVMATPMITGEADGALSRAGIVALFAVALAATPILASGAVGVSVVFARRFKRGDLVEVGGKTGRIVDVTLLDVQLEDSSSAEIRVPHLLALVRPTRIHRHPPLATLEVVVDPAAPMADVERALVEVAKELSARGRAELLVLDGTGARWRITSNAARGELTLATAVHAALEKINASLGRTTKREGEAT